MTTADLVPFIKKQPVGMACLVVTLLCGGALYYRSDAIAVSQAEYEAKSAEANKMLGNVKGAPGLAEQVAEIQALAKDLDSRLVRSSQLAVNLQYFYKLEADHGVKLLDVRQNPLVVRRGPKTTYTPVPFSLTVQGSYAQLVKFLGELQNGRHLCRIGSATFTQTGGTGDGTAFAPDVTLTINLDLLGQS
jgi:Tfp pilus assembly protein PilO